MCVARRVTLYVFMMREYQLDVLHFNENYAVLGDLEAEHLWLDSVSRINVSVVRSMNEGRTNESRMLVSDELCGQREK